jgi:hypothetical protein
MISGIQECYWNLQFSRQIGKTDPFWGLTFILAETEEALNTANVANFPTLPRRGIAP